MFKILTGKTQEHLVEIPNINRMIHKDAFNDFIKLKTAAEDAGFNFYITSSFRTFEDQLRIWNEKAEGKRMLLDPKGNQLNYADLSEEEIVNSILRWSAIPGASRHHWGTDFDVVDYNSVPEGYHVELTPQEVNGMFRPFFDWLEDRIDKNKSFGFYQPYKDDLGGVCPEAWHLSYRPVSSEYLRKFTIDEFRKVISNNSIMLNQHLLNRVDELYENFVLNIAD